MLAYKNFQEADQVMRFGNGRVEVVDLPGLKLGRAIMEPGWRWSEDVKPLVGTESCQVAHSACVVAGHMHVRMDDGAEIDLGPGDVHMVGPGHDAWVVGDEPLVIIDVLGVEEMAKILA